MDEKELFKKVFLDHHYDEHNYQLLNSDSHPGVIKKPTYEMWNIFKIHYDITYGKRKSSTFSTQRGYLSPRLKPWDPYYNIFLKPLNNTGFDWLEILRPQATFKKKLGYGKIKKLIDVVADISVNPIANPTLYFDTQKFPRVHPGKNLVSAHQILDKDINVIRFKRKHNPNKTNIRRPIVEIEEIKNIETLNELVDCYETTPIGFLEQKHIHMLCFHGNYALRDPRGYQLKLTYDLDLFCKEIAKNFDSKSHFSVLSEKEEVIHIPRVYDTKEITKFFQYMYKKDCFIRDEIYEQYERHWNK